MKSFSTILILFLASTFFSTTLFAIKATPYPINIIQPDGTELTVRLHGDEYFNYETTLDGYALVRDAEGILTYAKADADGNLISTAVRATNIEKRSAKEKQFIQNLKSNLDLSLLRRATRVSRAKSASTRQKSYPLKGTPKSLVILVSFQDKSFVTTDPQTAFTNLLNQKGYSTNGGTGSATDYFHDSSMGVFNPQFDVVGPYTLPQPMAYYGGNNASGNDVNPRQMVIDACTKASQAGVDFSQYDTDKDGVVDNVFIYYAGYNEAEGGPKNSIWPQRWTLADLSTIFNGVSVSDYACTSELRGNSGSTMCGIGTFCHEFGHVLGLPDYYVTSGTDHHTLSEWDIMDYGPYLNNGRTPPSYSAWDRFFLNWLTPTELKVGGNYSLDTLATSNKAYLITQNGNFNMSSTNPSPVEFFTLENRQQKGWDTYLPGHGMLVTHIFYNASDWQQNIVNNNAAAMGVDIVEADGTALTETSSVDPTLSGDPFPGTSNVTSYNPSLRDGTDLLKPVKNIRETNGIITFTLSKIATLANSTEVYFNNIAFVSSAQDASKTNVPANMIMNASNPANYLNPGSIFRFKMQCLNKKRDGTNIVSALCKVRCNDPCITITDSTAELNNIEYNSTTWTTDEFEVAIKNNAPVGHILHFDFIISEGSTDYYTYQVPIPVSPLSLQSITVDDDNNPDSRGNNNGICEPNEIIETLPSLQNISPLMVDSVIGTFDNYYSDTEGIHVWKNKAGSNGLVVNSSFWNYSFGAPHAIAAGATNILPQYDFVFNYNFLSTYHFTLGLAMSGKSQLFSGYQTDINWLIPIDYNAGYPDFNTGILSNNIGKIELYPNPTHGILNINMGRDNVDGYTINIVNTLCEKVYVSKLNTARVSIDISKIGKPGLFIIQILNQAGAVILDKKILFIN